MSSELLIKTPLIVDPVVLKPPAIQTLTAPTPEQIRAADTVFAHYEEPSSLADMVGFYAGMMLLGDMAQESLEKQAKEGETEEEKETGDV